MRRGLTLLSSGLIVLGLELSTETFSTLGARLVAGAQSLVTGSGYDVAPAVFVAGTAMVAGGVALAALLAWSGWERLRVEAVGRVCPSCGGETTRVRRSAGQRLLSRLTQEEVVRRRCKVCGWRGLALGR